jgi:hypothetical protein
MAENTLPHGIHHAHAPAEVGATSNASAARLSSALSAASWFSAETHVDGGDPA